MELKIIEEKKGKFIFEVPGVTHTVCNILKRELWQNSHVKAAAYTIRHPLIGTPEFIVETDGDEPRKVVAGACLNITKDLEKFAEAFKKEVK